MQRKILTFNDVAQPNKAVEALREIFFENHPGSDFESFTQYYYENFPTYFLISEIDCEIAGYLAICPDTSAVLGDLKYEYYRLFADLYDKYPAHLHINVKQKFQGQGVGSELLAYAKNNIAIDLHTITLKGHANAAFYLRNSFSLVDTRELNQKELIFLSNHQK